MWLLTALTHQQAPQAEVQPPYWPNGTQIAALMRPHGTGEHGGESATNARYSLELTGFENNPPYSEEYTRHIMQGFPGIDGREMQATYTPYDKVVGMFTQPGYRSVPAWQAMEFPLDHREQLRSQTPQGGMIGARPDPTRPLVYQTDYTLQNLTSDSSMVWGVDGFNYAGPDYNAE